MKIEKGLFTREVKIHMEFPDPDNPEKPEEMAMAYILSAKNRAITFRILIYDYSVEKRSCIQSYTKNGVYLCDVCSHSVYDDEGDHTNPHKDCRYINGQDCYSCCHTGSGVRLLKLLQEEKEPEW